MTTTEHTGERVPWATYQERYRARQPRPKLFCDMILDDVRRRASKPTMLDIGCGKGFDGDVELQRTLAAQSRDYIGIEPDPGIPLGEHLHQTHRCTLEEAPLQACSIDIAFAVMVLEHISEPEQFLGKLWEVLADGGVFWGFTVDARHFFCSVSRWMEHLRVKDLYLTTLKGRRGIERYENYPTYYRLNAPEQIRQHASRFRRCDFLSLSREGELKHYLPRRLRPLACAIDRRRIAAGRPGSTLVVRLEK